MYDFLGDHACRRYIRPWTPALGGNILKAYVLWCQGTPYGVAGWARRNIPCSPAGAGGLVDPVCWAASPGPPRVWLEGKKGQADIKVAVQFNKKKQSVVYVSGQDSTVADCLSRWAYSAGKAWMEISMHGDAETRPGGQEQRSQWHGQQHCLAQKT